MVRSGKALTLALCAALTMAVSGCATFAVPAYSPDYPTLDRLKTARLAPVAIQPFAPQDPAAPVNVLTLRGAPFAPAKGTFAGYIETAMRQDLAELRRLDPQAPTQLSATLLRNDFDFSGLSVGTGTIELRVVITRAGQTRLDKTYSASGQYESHLAANVAVPRAQAEYPSLVRRLLRNVYADAAFIAALQP